jgi:hypothetical protein
MRNIKAGALCFRLLYFDKDIEESQEYCLQGVVDMPIGLNPIQRNPERAKVIHQYLKEQEDNYGKMLATSFANVQKKTQEAADKLKKKKNKKLGSIRLSNTDNISKCKRVKAQLNARLGEIYASTMDEKMKQALAKDVMMQIVKVDMKINEIKKRELAIQQEKMNIKNDTEQAKRRRRKDIEERSTIIKRDFLHQEDGGTADASPVNEISADLPAVTAEIGGNEISLSDASAATAEMSAVSFEAVV